MGLTVLYPLVLIPFLMPPYLTGLAWNSLVQPNGLVSLLRRWGIDVP